MRDWGKSSWLFIAPCKGKRILESGILALESGMQPWESGSPFKIYWNSAPGIRNQRRGNHNPLLSWIPLLEALFTSMTDKLNTAWDCNETPSANWSQWNLAQGLVPVKLFSKIKVLIVGDKSFDYLVFVNAISCIFTFLSLLEVSFWVLMIGSRSQDWRMFYKFLLHTS